MIFSKFFMKPTKNCKTKRIIYKYLIYKLYLLDYPNTKKYKKEFISFYKLIWNFLCFRPVGPGFTVVSSFDRSEGLSFGFCLYDATLMSL